MNYFERQEGSASSVTVAAEALQKLLGSSEGASARRASAEQGAIAAAEPSLIEWGKLNSKDNN